MGCSYNPVAAQANINVSSGAPVERNSRNVSGYTDNGLGDITFNTISAVDANCIQHVTASPNWAGPALSVGAINTNAAGAIAEAAPTTSAFRCAFYDSAGNKYDPKYVNWSLLKV